VLKNAIDYLYAEWNNKAVGFVSYGNAGGARSVEHLRLVSGEPQMADVRAGTQGPQLARLERVRPGLRGQANRACRPCQQSAE
jgi:NAD(P)H-dependent FMN reductase